MTAPPRSARKQCELGTDLGELKSAPGANGRNEAVESVGKCSRSDTIALKADVWIGRLTTRVVPRSGEAGASFINDLKKAVARV